MEIELTTNIFNQLSTSNIFYVKIAGEVAMANSGGVLIYSIENDTLKCYQTNTSKNTELYATIKNQFFKNLNSSTQNKVDVKETLFNYYYGGMRNHVFANSNVKLNKRDYYFEIEVENKIHKIYPTVQGVFDSIINYLEKSKS